MWRKFVRAAKIKPKVQDSICLQKIKISYFNLSSKEFFYFNKDFPWSLQILCCIKIAFLQWLLLKMRPVTNRHKLPILGMLDSSWNKIYAQICWKSYVCTERYLRQRSGIRACGKGWSSCLSSSLRYTRLILFLCNIAKRYSPCRLGLGY